MAIISALSPISLSQFFYNSGGLVQPARLYFYRPQTETPIVVYSDALLSVPYPQPLLTGGSGRVPPVYVGVEPYRIRVFDAFGELVEDIDYLPGAVSTGGGGGGGGTPGAESLRTGDFILSFAGGGPRDGCVRANGGTIGSAVSTATERANDDTENLFLWLWGQDIDGLLPVLPSRGTSADGDWANAKILTLPDYRGGTFRGLDGMGQPATNRLKDVPFSIGQASKVGAVGGQGAAHMAPGQLAPHAHAMASAPTGVGINNAKTGLSVDNAFTGQTMNAAGTNVSIQAHATGISISGSGTGSYLIDPGHSHAYNPPTGAGAGPGSGGAGAVLGSGNTGGAYTGIALIDPTHTHGVSDPTHIHGVSDPSHVHALNDPRHRHTVTDAGHIHNITDPGHTHMVSDTGRADPLPTCGPFMTCTVYLKL